MSRIDRGRLSRRWQRRFLKYIWRPQQRRVGGIKANWLMHSLVCTYHAIFAVCFKCLCHSTFEWVCANFKYINSKNYFFIYIFSFLIILVVFRHGADRGVFFLLFLYGHFTFVEQCLSLCIHLRFWVGLSNLKYIRTLLYRQQQYDQQSPSTVLSKRLAWTYKFDGVYTVSFRSFIKEREK